MCECQNVNWALRDAARALTAAQRATLVAQAAAAIATGGREQVNPLTLLEYLGEATP